MRGWLAAAAALAFLAGPAAAQNPDDDLRRCASDDAAARITGCTAIIEAAGVPDAIAAAARINRGVAYSLTGEFDRAAADFTEAIRLKPDDAAARYGRATAYIALGDYAGAIADFDAQIQLDPGDPYSFNGRGLAYDEQGDYERAIADQDEAIRLKPDFAAAFEMRGAAYYDERQFDRAIADYDRAISLGSSSATLYDKRGLAYYQQGDYSAAIADYSRAIRLERDDLPAYYNRAGANFFSRNYKGALGDFAWGVWLRLGGMAGGKARDPVLAGIVLAVLASGFGVRRTLSRASLAAFGRTTAAIAAGVARRAGLLARHAWLPFLLSVAAAQFLAPLDARWDAAWRALGVPGPLIPASLSAIVFGLCLQVFAVRAHQVAGGGGLDWSGAFWRAYGRFNGYAVALFATGFAGLVAGFFIPNSWLTRKQVLIFSLSELAFIAIAVLCVAGLSAVARCALMLPAAARDRPLSPAAAWRLQRGASWQMSLIATVFIAFSAGLNWAAGALLALLPGGLVPPALQGLGGNVAGQLATYLGVALVAATLSLFYGELVASRR